MKDHRLALLCWGVALLVAVLCVRAATARDDALDLRDPTPFPVPVTLNTYAWLKVTSPRVNLSRVISWAAPGEPATDFRHVYMLQHPAVDVEFRGKKVLVTIRDHGFVRCVEGK